MEGVSVSNLLGIVAVVELLLGDVGLLADRARVGSAPAAPVIFRLSRSAVTLPVTHFQ